MAVERACPKANSTCRRRNLLTTGGGSCCDSGRKQADPRALAGASKTRSGTPDRSVVPLLGIAERWSGRRHAPRPPHSGTSPEDSSIGVSDTLTGSRPDRRTNRADHRTNRADHELLMSVVKVFRHVFELQPGIARSRDLEASAATSRRHGWRRCVEAMPPGGVRLRGVEQLPGESDVERMWQRMLSRLRDMALCPITPCSAPCSAIVHHARQLVPIAACIDRPDARHDGGHGRAGGVGRGDVLLRGACLRDVAMQRTTLVGHAARGIGAGDRRHGRGDPGS